MDSSSTGRSSGGHARCGVRRRSTCRSTKGPATRAAGPWRSPAVASERRSSLITRSRSPRSTKTNHAAVRPTWRSARVRAAPRASSTRAAAPVVDDRARRQPAHHRRHEGVGDHRRHAVAGVEAASATRSRRFHGHTSRVSSASQERTPLRADRGAASAAPRASMTAVRCRTGPRGAPPRGLAHVPAPETCRSRSKAVSGSYTRRYEANSDGTAESFHETGVPRPHAQRDGTTLDPDGRQHPAATQDAPHKGATRSGAHKEGVFSAEVGLERARAGRLLPGPAVRPEGHHRHLLDSPRAALGGTSF